MRRELLRTVEREDQVLGTAAWVEAMVRKGLARGPVTVSLGRPRRSLDQNALLWAVLTDISRQVEWHGQYLTKENWKDIFTAALKRQQVVPGLEGGFVVLGTSTRRMTKREFSGLIELIYSFGAEHGVRWSEPAQETFSQHRRAA